MEKRTLKYFLDNKNFSKIPQKREKKVESSLSVVDDQIVFNVIDPQRFEEEIVTSFTYMSKKGNRKRWSPEENILFYKSLECCGCDFSMMNILFPDRSRSNLKEKYKKECKINNLKIENALDNYKKFNMEKFNELKKEMDTFHKLSAQRLIN